MNEQALLHAVAEGHTMHALLIAGPEGSGRRALARKAAAAFCFGVPETARLAACPDYLEIGETPVGVGDVRELIAATAAQAFSGGRRAFLLCNAHRMTVQAQNALLKTLEEPPADTLLILTGTEMGLLPTIRSRCAIWRLGARPVEEIAETLVREGVPEERARLAAAWADGVPGKARQMADDAYAAFRAEAAKLFSEALFSRTPFEQAAALVQKTALAPAAAAADGKKTKPDADNAARLFEIWLSIARDALVLRTGGAAPLSGEQDGIAERMAKNFTIGRIQGIIETILDAQKALSYRASPVMTADAAMVRLIG